MGIKISILARLVRGISVFLSNVGYTIIVISKGKEERK